MATKKSETKEKAPAIDTAPIRKEIEDRLRSTKRDGIDGLIDYMDYVGFYKAPASGGNHLHIPGGLAQHTINVLHAAEKISVAVLGGANLTIEMRCSIIIAAILHDLGKTGDYNKAMYVANKLKSGNISEAKPWKRNPELYNIPHGIRSVKLATMYIDLEPDEEIAIMYHDGFQELSNRPFLGTLTTYPPLLLIIHWADMWASQVMEKDDNENKESEE